MAGCLATWQHTLVLHLLRWRQSKLIRLRLCEVSTSPEQYVLIGMHTVD
jgi:hypothetical protein